MRALVCECVCAHVYVYARVRKRVFVCDLMSVIFDHFLVPKINPKLDQFFWLQIFLKKVFIFQFFDFLLMRNLLQLGL